MKEISIDTTGKIVYELSDEIKALVAEEVKRQLNERWNKMVNEARLGSAMKFEPMRPTTDSRGIPHHMTVGQGGEHTA